MGPRVVSLVPSTTETLRAWGVDIIACTRYCEQPDLRHVGGTKDPDVAGIVSLGPDLVVMDHEENRREDAEALAAAGLTVHATDVRDVRTLDSTLSELAAAVGVAYTPEPLPPAEAPWARAFVPIWRRPLMTMSGGCYGSSLLAAIGFDNVFTDAGERYPEVDVGAVVARRPEIVLAPSEPYPFSERHRAELEAIAPVRFVDGQDLFWWGVRTPAALERLAAALA